MSPQGMNIKVHIKVTCINIQYILFQLRSPQRDVLYKSMQLCINFCPTQYFLCHLFTQARQVGYSLFFQTLLPSACPVPVRFYKHSFLHYESRSFNCFFLSLSSNIAFVNSFLNPSSSAYTLRSLFSHHSSADRHLCYVVSTLYF